MEAWLLSSSCLFNGMNSHRTTHSNNIMAAVHCDYVCGALLDSCATLCRPLVDPGCSSLPLFCLSHLAWPLQTCRNDVTAELPACLPRLSMFSSPDGINSHTRSSTSRAGGLDVSPLSQIIFSLSTYPTLRPLHLSSPPVTRQPPRFCTHSPACCLLLPKRWRPPTRNQK